MKRIAPVLGALALVACTASPPATQPGTPAGTQAAGTAAATEATPTPTAAPPAAAEWAEVISVSGNANKRTEVFELSDAPARLRWEATSNVEGFDTIAFAAYVMAEGTSLAEQGGIPEVFVTESGADETQLVKGAGRYYLDVTAANCDWTVVIEQQGG